MPGGRRPGEVKTRLAMGVGNEVAARCCEAFTHDLVARLRQGAHALVLMASPGEQAAAFARAYARFRKEDRIAAPAQRGGVGDHPHAQSAVQPVGAHLPPNQAVLEADYKRELHANYGITFNRLYTVTNQPVGRFRDQLERTGALEKYQRKLEDAFNPQTADGVMCRTLLSIGYDGRMYDCDFNQMLDRPIGSVFDLSLPETGIRFDNHCFACTAGAGST